MLQAPRIFKLLLWYGTAIAQGVSHDPKEIDAGGAAFRIYCSPCHGMRGAGGRGPDLTRGVYSIGESDADLFRVISNGVAGTEMPGYTGTGGPETTWRMVSYIRSIARREVAALPGNAQSGEVLFWGQGACGNCHTVGARGGPMGPDLSRVGRQHRSAHLRDAIVNPDAEVTAGYATITMVTKEGRKIVGVQRGFDDFSAQLIDIDGTFWSFERSQVRSTWREPRSLMPAVRFTSAQVDDLVAYLYSLRGEEAH